MAEEKELSFEEVMQRHGTPQEFNDAPKEEQKEQPKETPKESPVETPKEEPKETPKEQPKDEPQEFDFGAFSKYVNREINDKESLEALFEKVDKYDDVNSEYETTKQRLSEYQELAKKINPLAHFKNEDEYKRQQLLIKYGDTLGSDAVKELSVLSGSKVKEMSDVDALKLQLMVDKGVSASDAEAYLMRKYDISDFSDEDIEAGVKTAMKIDAVDARRQVEKLYEDIEVPSQMDYETVRQQTRDTWKQPLSELKNSLDKVQILEDLDINVTESMLKNIDIDGTLNQIANSGAQLSEEALGEIAGSWRDQIVLRNLKDIVKAAKSQEREAVEAEWRQKVHNDRPLDDAPRDDNPTKKSNDDLIREIL